MNITFLIITFNPDSDQFKRNLRRNILSSSNIIIVDNSTQNESINFVASLSSDCIIVIQNYNNNGIAGAQNIGFSKFLEQGGEYLVQLDQDSSIDSKSLKLLTEYYIHNSKICKIAGVGPGEVNSCPRTVREIKSSGLLIHRSVIVDIGFMQCDLFIDLVDYEWCWRAKRKGYSFHSVPCDFFHQLGVNHKLFGFWEISIPSPIRHYYQVRNSLRLIFTSKSPLKWSLLRLPILLIKLFAYPILLPDGKSRLIYMMLGFIHFCMKKTGAIPVKFHPLK